MTRSVIISNVFVFPPDPPAVIPVISGSPEASFPFVVYPVSNFTGSDGRTEYKGYYILLKINERFPEMDEDTNWYHAKLQGAHQVLVKVPAWPFCLWPDSKDKTKSLALYESITSQVATPVVASMHACHSQFDPKEREEEGLSPALFESRKWWYYLLDFSKIEGIEELSAEVIHNKDEESPGRNVLEFDYIEVPVKMDEMGEPSANETYLRYKVACVEGNRKITREEAKKSRLKEKQEKARRGRQK